MKRRTGTILAAVASLLCLAGAAEVSTNGLVHVEKLGHCGFNGAPGVRVRPIGGKRGTYRLDLAFVLKARQKYVFTIYRRIHGNVRPHHYWQCWGRDGWCRGQNWNAKVTPLDSVGVYVPGGRALYPSTLLMNAIPASVAGVERIVVVNPPSRECALDPAIA